jgi:hypothetical protein
MSNLLATLIYSILLSLVMIFTLFLMRSLLRNQKVAVAICIILFTLMSGPENIPCFTTLLASSCLTIYLLLRFGLLASIFALFLKFFPITAPITLQADAWYFDTGFLALTIMAAIILYAFYTSLGGRPIFGTPRLDD